ncbi:unnamed protein product, partial [Laminaria digitata]
GGIDATTATAATASSRQATTNLLSGGVSRRSSAQWGSRRASAFARQAPHDRGAQGGAPRRTSLVTHLSGRPASVPITPSKDSWGSPALGAAAAAPSTSRRKASLLPVKEGASGRQGIASIESEKTGGDGCDDTGVAKGRGSVGSIPNSKGEPLDAGLQFPVSNV